MAILPIYVYEQQVLRKRAKPVKQVDEALRTLVANMFDTMHRAGGVGLAANQVGSLHRIVVIDVGESEERREPRKIVLLNPEIVREEGMVPMEEGCLSLPDLREEIDRPERVTVRFKDLDLQDQEIYADGMLARVLQHEIDHLNGVLFIDKLGLVRRKLLTGRLNKMKRGESEAPYPVIGAIEVPADPNAPKTPLD